MTDLDYNHTALLKSLLATGFDERLKEPLREQLQQRLPAFLLDYRTTFDDLELTATLYIKKWQDCPLYYLRKYHAVLQQGPQRESVGQDFYFARMSPMITVPEAYDLLNGKRVYRDICRHKDRLYENCWLQLDWTQTDAMGNYRWIYATGQTTQLIV